MGHSDRPMIWDPGRVGAPVVEFDTFSPFFVYSTYLLSGVNATSMSPAFRSRQRACSPTVIDGILHLYVSRD